MPNSNLLPAAAMDETPDLLLEPLIPEPQGELQVPPLDPGASNIELSLVIPTFNERPNITQLILQLDRLLQEKIPGRYELIVVDDDSPDGTWEVAHELTTQIPRLRVMRRLQGRCLSRAVIRGWQAARGRFLAVIDGDLQHPPETILQLLDEVQNGADLAVASRNTEDGGVSDWSLFRRAISRGAQIIGIFLLPEVLLRVSDPMSGYFIVRRAAIEQIRLRPFGYKLLVELLARGDIHLIREVSYVFQERRIGQSKLTWKQMLEYLRHLLLLRFRRRSRKPA